MEKGKIYLIPTPISDRYTLGDVLLPIYKDIVLNIEFFVVETAKTGRAHLGGIETKKAIRELDIKEFNKNTEDSEIDEILKPVFDGMNIGVLSDAGIPSIADPAFKLLGIAQENNIEIVPMVGPSSIFMALSASGLNGQEFAFVGYIPKDKGLKRKRIKTLERIATNTDQTQIFMETPYKNEYMLEDILEVCEEKTKLCIASDIMGEGEYIETKTISEWKKDIPSLPKLPCLFILGK